MYKISQTLIKLFKQDYCPTYIKEVYIDKNYASKPSIAMLRGLYFETQVIGSGAHGQSVNNLPLLKNGTKSASHQRVDRQVRDFQKTLGLHNMVILDTQTVLTYKFDDNLELNGTLDCLASLHDDVLGDVDKAIVDIKLTSSIYKEFGDWSWHFPHNMDHTQAVMYTYLYEQMTGEQLPFYYLVFDYAPNPSYKIVRKEITNMDKAELDESIRRTLDKILYHEKNDWGYNPSYSNCKLCPMNQTCPEYTKAKKVEVI